MILSISNLPTSLCDSTTLVNNKHSHTSRNQEANQVNIPTVRTKTGGSNSIKSKSANIWNYLNKLFHSEQLIHQKRSFQTSQTQVCVAQVLSSICFGKATRI